MSLLGRALPLVMVFLLVWSSPNPAVRSASHSLAVETRSLPCQCQATPSAQMVFPPRTAAPDPPSYDEQVGETFTQSFTAIAFNITAVEQADPISDTGPAYLLNGLTTTGYWYQLGLSWNWNPGNVPGNGWDFLYEVWDANGNSIYPTSGAGVQSLSPVSSGDTVLLNLYFSGSEVVMLVYDYNSGAKASLSYSAEGASQFMGLTGATANSKGYFTGLMTEWYHSSAFYGNILPERYTNPNYALTSAYVWADEFSCADLSCTMRTTQFSAATAMTFTDPSQLQAFSSNGVTAYASAFTLITGRIGTAQITLSYSITGGGSGFSPPSLSYILNGTQHNATLTGTPQAFEADLGTGWQANKILGGSTQDERWASNMSGFAVTSALSLVILYYHQFYCTFGYFILGGGPTDIAPEVTFNSFGNPSAHDVSANQWVDSGSSYAYPALIGNTSSSERWAANTTVTGKVTQPGTVGAVDYFHQYAVFVTYHIEGGGFPSGPSLNGTQFGKATSVPVANRSSTFVDAESSWAVSRLLQGSTSLERWFAVEGLGNSSISGPQGGAVTYEHQYNLTVASNFAKGGDTNVTSSWVMAGSSAGISAKPSAGWQFEGWNGTGTGSYSGGDSVATVKLGSAVNEVAIFYPGVNISAGANGQVSYSYGSKTGVVPAGTSFSLYAPPGTSVSLSATPTSVLYAFGGWSGAPSGNPAQTSFVLTSPGVSMASFSFNFLIIGGAGAAVLLLVALVAVLTRRKKP